MGHGWLDNDLDDSLDDIADAGFAYINNTAGERHVACLISGKLPRLCHAMRTNSDLGLARPGHLYS